MPKTKQFDEAEVLEKARNVFWKQGYNGTSMDELVKATGLSRSSIYDTFGDKHGLYIASLKAYKNQQQEMLLKKIPASLPAIKKIEWLYKNTICQALDDKQRKGCFMLNTTTELANVDSDIKKIVAGNMDEMENVFTALVKEGQANGGISKKFTATALAKYLFSNYSGLVIVGQTKPDKTALEDIMKVSLSVLS